MKKIALFNHIGGVGKTTITFNLAWKLSELGKKVLMVDADPQCYLTGICRSLTHGANSEDFYTKGGVSNFKVALDPVFSGIDNTLVGANCYEFANRKGLFLLHGYNDVSESDAAIRISHELTGSINLVQNIPGAINKLIELTSERYNFDYVIIDMSPSVSATNANLFMLSDFFIIPCSPDFTCNLAISSLTSILPNWFDTYSSIKTNLVFRNALYKFPVSTPKFIGTIQQRYGPRNGESAKSFQARIDNLNQNIINNLVPVLKANEMIIDEAKFATVSIPEEPFNLINIPDFNCLIAQSQKYNTPIYRLNDDQLEKGGMDLVDMKAIKEVFNETFDLLAHAMIHLTNKQNI